MNRRSVVTVILLSFVTFGIYSIVWAVSTKREMVAQGADIPTSWLLIVPIASIYWFWKWCGGVERVTGGKLSQAVTLLLMLLLGIIGMAIVQDAFNKAPASVGQLPSARVA